MNPSSGNIPQYIISSDIDKLSFPRGGTVYLDADMIELVNILFTLFCYFYQSLLSSPRRLTHLGSSSISPASL